MTVYLDGIRKKVFDDRYALKNSDGQQIEQTPEEMWRRVARAIASVEKTEERRSVIEGYYYDLLSDFKFVPSGRILSGAGSGHEVTYFNCYVVGLGEHPTDPSPQGLTRFTDTRQAIDAVFKTLTEMTDLMARAGGAGINFSMLPPRGYPLTTRHKPLTPLSPVAMMRLDHPDIVQFLEEESGPLMSGLEVGVIFDGDDPDALPERLRWLEQDYGPYPTERVRELLAQTRVHRYRSALLDTDITVADSRAAILKAACEMTHYITQGAIPFLDFTALRPKGSYIKTVNGTSSGPVSWMYLFASIARSFAQAGGTWPGTVAWMDVASTITGKIVQQGGSRRGALMVMLDDNHPDLLEFIEAKKLGANGVPMRIEHANMSIAMSDTFMSAVEHGHDWTMAWEDTDMITLPAREIFHRICRQAWQTAEPGIVWIERGRKQSNTWYFENLRCVNPCFTGDTLLYTDRGLERMRDLASKGPHILYPQLDTRMGAGEKGLSDTGVFVTGHKDVVRVETKEGYYLRCTPDHRIRTTTGWVEAQNLKDGDKILLMNHKGGFGSRGSYNLGLVMGWTVGDGTINDENVQLLFFGAKRALVPLFAQAIDSVVNQVVAANGRTYTLPKPYVIEERDEERLVSSRLLPVFADHGLTRENKRCIPESVFTATEEMQRGFLQALFSADGHFEGKAAYKGMSVRLSSISRDMLVGVQQLLLNFGIACRIYKRRSAMMRFLPDGHGGLKGYPCQENYDLIIGKENVITFVQEIGFLQDDVQKKIKSGIEQYRVGPYKEHFTARFLSCTPDGREDVYDLTEWMTHSCIVNGISSHQCGEQILPPGGVCNLGAINLARYVDSNGAPMLDQLWFDVMMAVRFLDAVIDATGYWNDLNREMQQNKTRRIGLGTMGLADALIKMKLRYGSPESMAMIERIYTHIRDAAYTASANLAREKGTFGAYDRDKYLGSAFIQTLPNPIQSMIADYGIRNAVLLTQAPTGTTSLLAGYESDGSMAVSSGIEPVFDFAMLRTDRTGTHELYHPALEAWEYDHPGLPLPDYFVSAKGLTPEEHIAVQATVQKYVDASISKTCNLPNSATVEDIERLYRMAYQQGCKGVTCYRDGSRDAVLTSIPVEQPQAAAEIPDLLQDAEKVVSDAVQQGHLKPRPPVLWGYTRNVVAPEGTVNITINHDEDGPLEMFLNVGRAGSDVAALAEGFGRLISLVLRLPSSMTQDERLSLVGQQLGGIGGSRQVGFGPNRVLSLPDAVSHAIQDHIVGNTVDEAPEAATPIAAGKVTGNICAECGSNSVVREEGCIKCRSCGWSAC